MDLDIRPNFIIAPRMQKFREMSNLDLDQKRFVEPRAGTVALSVLSALCQQAPDIDQAR
jgi:hypothetical protein